MIPQNEQGERSFDLRKARVFPLQSKIPHCRWKYVATAKDNPLAASAAFGIVCDEPFCVIDFDDDKSRSDYPDGCLNHWLKADNVTFEQLRASFGLVKTPHGFHLYCASDPVIQQGQGFQTSEGKQSFIDVRAHGSGYVVGPGSTIPADEKSVEPVGSLLHYQAFFAGSEIPLTPLQTVLPSLYTMLARSAAKTTPKAGNAPLLSGVYDGSSNWQPQTFKDGLEQLKNAAQGTAHNVLCGVCRYARKQRHHVRNFENWIEQIRAAAQQRGIPSSEVENAIRDFIESHQTADASQSADAPKRRVSSGEVWSEIESADGQKLEVRSFTGKDHSGLAAFAYKCGVLDGCIIVNAEPEKVFRRDPLKMGLFSDATNALQHEIDVFMQQRCRLTNGEPYPSDKSTINSLICACIRVLKMNKRCVAENKPYVFEDGKTRELKGSEFVTPKGVYDFYSQQEDPEKALSKDYFATKLQLRCLPDYSIEAPQFESLLQSIGAVGDKRIRLLEGLALVVLGKIEGMPPLIPSFSGPAGCGKSTLAKHWVQYVCGDKLSDCAAVSPQDLKDQFMRSKANEYRELVIDDAEQVKDLGEIIKNRGCGETVTELVNYKNREPRTITTSYRIALIANRLQKGIKDEGGCIQRRFLNVVFDRRRCEPVIDLAKKLEPESPKILALLAESADGMIQRGKPTSIDEDEEYRAALAADGDPIKQFIFERLEPRADGRLITAEKLYSDYKLFCEDFATPKAKSVFAREFKAAIENVPGFEGCGWLHTRNGNGYPIALKPMEDQTPMNYTGSF